MEEARPEVAVTYAESASAPERGEGRGAMILSHQAVIELKVSLKMS